MIDGETRLDSVTAIDDTMIFVYTLVNHGSEEITQNFKNFLYNQAVNGYCTALGEAKSFKENNIGFKIHYRGIDGKFITVISINASDCLGKENTVTFRSSEYQFLFNYPGEWEVEQTRFSGTVIKVISPDGGLSFNVGAEWDRSLRNVHPTAFVKKFSKRGITKLYKKYFVNFRLLEAGETTLCNQPAYYVAYTHALNSSGQQKSWKNMTIFSNRSGIQYTLTVGGYPKQFDQNSELITRLFRSFVTYAPILP